MRLAAGSEIDIAVNLMIDRVGSGWGGGGMGEGDRTEGPA